MPKICSKNLAVLQLGFSQSIISPCHITPFLYQPSSTVVVFISRLIDAGLTCPKV